jgi:hypothetical protein
MGIGFSGFHSNNIVHSHLSKVSTMSMPHAVRGFDLENNGLLSPALSSFGEEREKNRAVRGARETGVTDEFSRKNDAGH